jgi:hypothetical protein
MIKSPTSPCPKCGGHVWDGPKWVPQVWDVPPRHPGEGKLRGRLDSLSYRCLGCGWVMYVAPLDRRDAPAPVPYVCDQPGE